jgi:hypothetical protein
MPATRMRGAATGAARIPEEARMDFAVRIAPWAALLSIALCAACAETPQQAADAHAAKIYRTGSNIPVKDYGAENFDVANPDVINPSNRPMANVLGRKPGQ